MATTNLNFPFRDDVTKIFKQQATGALATMRLRPVGLHQIAPLFIKGSV